MLAAPVIGTKQKNNDSLTSDHAQMNYGHLSGYPFISCDETPLNNDDDHHYPLNIAPLVFTKTGSGSIQNGMSSTENDA